VSNDGLGEGKSDSVELGDVTTTSHSDSDVKLLEVLLTEQEIWLKDLVSEDWGTNQLKRNTIHSEGTLTNGAGGNGKSISLSAEGLDDNSIRLLLGLAHQS
jgi:hypothetical protein